ncbi:hypothetical protein SBRY_40726 [Actinacidiphila bryophytorum]|uniref:Uncharacterized protein n=1 Tax=Actinacidiphila bryophytorum TaxID=1436133 RepID=A0A9W4MC29_9ACTN|nr:hypothetical protein SBRY_40726 [Actinacidiphila bryophytorum]
MPGRQRLGFDRRAERRQGAVVGLHRQSVETEPGLGSLAADERLHGTGQSRIHRPRHVPGCGHQRGIRERCQGPALALLRRRRQPPEPVVELRARLQHPDTRPLERRHEGPGRQRLRPDGGPERRQGPDLGLPRRGPAVLVPVTSAGK